MSFLRNETEHLRLLWTLPPRSWGSIILCLAALPGVVLVYFHNPAETDIFPPCILYSLTNVQCPGCGALRAFHYLMHGNLSIAFGYHPGVVVSLPFVVCAMLLALSFHVSGRRLPTAYAHPAMIWGLLLTITILGVLRNIPVHPLALSI